MSKSSSVKAMTSRERALAVLNYQSYDRLPIVHFGLWGATYQKWVAEGHMPVEANCSPAKLGKALGFDFGWENMYGPNHWMDPPFESKEIKRFLDGTTHVLNGDGVVLMQRPGAAGIPAEIDHLLKDRASWEEQFKWRFQWTPERVTHSMIHVDGQPLRFDQGGCEWLKQRKRDGLFGLHCGSLYGSIRSMLGVEGACYLMADDEELFDEIIQTVADITYRNVELVLQSGIPFDFGHFWEDICFKNGPLIAPAFFKGKVGPHYARITRLLKKHDIHIVSLDCDGKIDALVPIWLEIGVNTMFPIEVGTWGASIKPWREQYGTKLLGVGGRDKTAIARDRAAVEAEVE
ncbi:MAG: hypothetical protein NTX84_07790, partial [Nitrospirae bacterium]|nr:hypothetical protein [Nitrospirota bacterium]